MKGKLTQTIRGWLAGGLATMLALGMMSGCQPLFMGKEVYDPACMQATLPPAVKMLEDKKCPIVSPLTPRMPAPANVVYPEREPCPVTLQWCLAKALENGLPSGNTQEGKADQTLVRLPLGTTTVIGQTDRVRVLALNPAIANAQIEQSLARFDAVWVTGMNWTNTDNLLQGLQSFSNGNGANFNTSVVKAFADGGVASLGILTNYQQLSTAPTVQQLNPQYTTRVSIGYELPLWRDAGVDINQLLSRFPTLTGQMFNNNSLAALGHNAHQGAGNLLGAGNVEGILVSKLRFDQSRTEFERNMHVLVKNVEIAYWTLYNKYGQLYSFEENLRILRRAYEENYYKHKAGGGNLKPYQFFQSKGQFEEFRANRVQAMQEVLDAERNLRGILGLPVEDGCRLVPITPPQLAEMRPDWDQCLQDTLNLRPELLLARDNLRYHQYLLQISQNFLKPDLRVYGRYEPVGFGTSLTGDDTFIDNSGLGQERSSNAFRSLKSMHFADYQLGIYMNVPIGQRLEHAQVRASRMQLAQSYYLLRDQEERAILAMTEQYQEVSRWYKQIEAHRAERLAYADALNSFINLIKAGTENYGKLDFLSIQRSYSAALVKEYNAIAEYNNALAKLEWTKGTTLRYNNVHVSEGALPECAQVNASQYEKERTRSLVLKQRPDSLAQPGRFCSNKEADVPVPGDLPPVNMNEEPLTAPGPKEFVPPAPRELPKLLPPISGKMPGPLNASWTPTKEKPGEFMPAFFPAKETVSKDPGSLFFRSTENLEKPADRRVEPVRIETPTPPIRNLPKLIDGPVTLPLLPPAPPGLPGGGSVGIVTMEEEQPGPRAPSPQVLDFSKQR